MIESESPTHSDPDESGFSRPFDENVTAADIDNSRFRSSDHSTDCTKETSGATFVEVENDGVRIKTASGTDVNIEGTGDANAREDELALIEKLKDELARERAAFHNFRMARAKQAEVERTRTRSEVVRVILPILDDFARIEKHSDPDEAFKSIAAKLRSSMEKIGLTSFGNPGDAFDPELHEAVFQNSSEEVQTETVQEVIEAGYRLDEVVIRVAKVVVQVPNG